MRITGFIDSLKNLVPKAETCCMFPQTLRNPLFRTLLEHKEYLFKPVSFAPEIQPLFRCAHCFSQNSYCRVCKDLEYPWPNAFHIGETGFYKRKNLLVILFISLLSHMPT